MIFDPINLTDYNTGVSPLSLGAQKTECNVEVGQEVNVATPERFNFGNSPPEGPYSSFVFFLDFPKTMLLK